MTNRSGKRGNKSFYVEVVLVLIFSKHIDLYYFQWIMRSFTWINIWILFLISVTDWLNVAKSACICRISAELFVLFVVSVVSSRISLFVEFDSDDVLNQWRFPSKYSIDSFNLRCWCHSCCSDFSMSVFICWCTFEFIPFLNNIFILWNHFEYCCSSIRWFSKKSFYSKESQSK